MNPPPGEVAADDGGMFNEVSFAEPADDPREGEVVDVVEGARGRAVTEVVVPAPQRQVQPAQQVCKRSTSCSASQQPHLC